MTQSILFATENLHKVQEVIEILAELKLDRFSIRSLKDLENYVSPVETGTTFFENARIKALSAADFSGEIAFADDSGLEVEILGNQPGIYSSRYGGEEKNYSKNNLKLLEALSGVPFEKRQAQFRCVMVAINPVTCQEIVAEGFLKGYIGFEAKGEFGFGYDPLFFLPEYQKTLGEIGYPLKNHLSHRANALKILFSQIDLLF